LIGTTDVPFDGDPSAVNISAQEVTYLCDTVNSYFQRSLAPGDVIWSYSGVRPLSDDETANVSKVTRDYKLELNVVGREPPLLSVFGGKITTYRKLAEGALEKLRPYLGSADLQWTDRSPLPGGDVPSGDMSAFVAEVQLRWPFLSDQLAWRMSRAYGTRIGAVLGEAKQLGELGIHFGNGLTQREVDYLRAHEWAITAEDILWRRTKCGLHMTATEKLSVQRYVESHGTVQKAFAVS
jgi:glycerol-3-phosphate dehydrogenase